MRKFWITMAALVAANLTACAQITPQGDEEQFRQVGASEHQQMMQDMTKEMYQELREMMKDMKGGDVTSAKMKEMDKHMGRISLMISRMSGVRDQMFRQMAAMQRDPTMQSPAK